MPLMSANFDEWDPKHSLSGKQLVQAAMICFIVAAIAFALFAWL